MLVNIGRGLRFSLNLFGQSTNNMKKISLSLLGLLVAHLTFAQCVIEPWSLEKRLNKSSLVIEGEVISKQSYWDNQHHNIYTVNDIKVYKVFKGSVTSDVIQVVTLGGTVGLKNHTVTPSLQFEGNDIGIFLLKSSNTSIEDFSGLFMPTASLQSFVQYNLTDFTAHDFQNSYHSIKFDLYERIKGLTGEGIQNRILFDPEKNRKKIRALAPPVISSFSVDTVSAGTGTILNINGSNFGFARGSGKVGFKDANFGDGRYYYTPYDWSYVSWSNSQIRVYVPPRAGTGKVEVVNNLSESGESSDDLYIKWSHLNVTYVPSGTDTQFYEVDHVNRNGNGGYLWQYNTNFAANSPASASFIRAIEEWRCETQMNWDLGNNTTVNVTADDNVNIVRFTEFGSSTLGRCWSRRSGCFHSGGIDWFVDELDIEFDSTYNWYYGTGTTPSGQYDFETVALHELGHGHQLGHVRDNSKVMHYAVSTGTQKTDLVPEDIEAGVYIKNKGVASSPCGSYGSMQAISSGACQLTPPLASFEVDDTTICPLTDVEFTDNSTGTVSTYAWDFGADASPATANTAGPHTVQYSSSGMKTVRLITSNSFGPDTATTTIEVLPDDLSQPTFLAQYDSGCLGFADYEIDIVDSAEGYQWSLSGGGTFVGSTNATLVQVEWTDTGSHVISAIAANECAVSAQANDTITVYPLPTAAFSESSVSTTATFTSEAEFEESHFWDFGDGTTSTDENPVHQFPDKGTYSVKYKVSSLCGDDSITQNVTVDFSASVDDISDTWKVFPNPVSKNQFITVEGEKLSYFKWIDVQGRTVFDSEMNGNTVKVPNVEPGTYLLNIGNEHKQAQYSIVIRE